MARESQDVRRQRLAERVRTLPEGPGCYVMKNRRGEIFYIGKAANLRARVRSYFSGSDSRAFVSWLDELLHDLEIIVVRTEKEALLLERTLVKQHQPRFNVKLRDDKNFIHLRLRLPPPARTGGGDAQPSLRQRYPRVEVVRGAPDDDARTFGPYHSATAARATLRVLNRHFQLRTCRDAVLDNRVRPCLQHQIGRCPAPCVHDVPDYGERLQDAALFLSGRGQELTERLLARMHEAAEREEFELAARLRDQGRAVAASLDDQVVADVERRRNQDVVAVARSGALLVVVRVIVRDGHMQGTQTHSFDKAEFPTEELLSSTLVQLYADAGPATLPDELLVSCSLGDDEAALADVLSERRGHRVEVKVPQRGHNRRLLEIAQKNADQVMADTLRRQDQRERGLLALQERLALTTLPRTIECFDISLFQGTDPVASQVCFVDGAPKKSRYRRYNIKTVEGTDDFAMLHESLTRRLRRGLESNDLPDLLLIDGGKGQLHVAMAVCRDLGIRIANAAVVPGAATFPADAPSVCLASVAKARTFSGGVDERPQTLREDRTGLSDAPEAQLQMSPERLFAPGQKDPIVLRPHTADRFLVEQLRDEAHRFAITAHRGLRNKRTLRSVLDEIPGVGPQKRKALLVHLGSARNVQQASIAEIAAVPGIGDTLAARIRSVLHGEPEAQGPSKDESSNDDLGRDR